MQTCPCSQLFKRSTLCLFESVRLFWGSHATSGVKSGQDRESAGSHRVRNACRQLQLTRYIPQSSQLFYQPTPSLQIMDLDIFVKEQLAGFLENYKCTNKTNLKSKTCCCKRKYFNEVGSFVSSLQSWEIWTKWFAIGLVTFHPMKHLLASVSFYCSSCSAVDRWRSLQQMTAVYWGMGDFTGQHQYDVPRDCQRITNNNL